MATKFLEGNFEEILEVQDTNDAFDLFYTKSEAIIQENLPLKRVKINCKTRSKPWYSEGLRISNNKKINLYKEQLRDP